MEHHGPEHKHLQHGLDMIMIQMLTVDRTQEVVLIQEQVRVHLQAQVQAHHQEQAELAVHLFTGMNG